MNPVLRWPYGRTAGIFKTGASIIVLVIRTGLSRIVPVRRIGARGAPSHRIRALVFRTGASIVMGVSVRAGLPGRADEPV